MKTKQYVFFAVGLFASEVVLFLCNHNKTIKATQIVVFNAIYQMPDLLQVWDGYLAYEICYHCIPHH